MWILTNFQVCSRVKTCWLVHLKSKKNKGCTGGPLCTVGREPDKDVWCAAKPWTDFLSIKVSFQTLCPWPTHEQYRTQAWKSTSRGKKKKKDSLQPNRNYLSINREPWHIFPACRQKLCSVWKAVQQIQAVVQTMPSAQSIHNRTVFASCNTFTIHDITV